jgi:hypothetical protein
LEGWWLYTTVDLFGLVDRGVLNIGKLRRPLEQVETFSNFVVALSLDAADEELPRDTAVLSISLSLSTQQPQRRRRGTVASDCCVSRERVSERVSERECERERESDAAVCGQGLLLPLLLLLLLLLHLHYSQPIDE